jgi:hypothetical protein
LEIGITKAKVEGDSPTIVKALNADNLSSSHYGLLVSDAKSLTTRLRSSSFLHVKRQGNCLAHALAHKAKHFDNLEVWMEAAPPDIDSLYLSSLPVF